MTTLAIAMSSHFGMLPIGTTGTIALFVTFGGLALSLMVHMVGVCCCSSIPPFPEEGGEPFLGNGLYVIERSQRATIYSLERPILGRPFWRQLEVKVLVLFDLSHIQSANQLGDLLPDQVLLYRHKETRALWGMINWNGQVYHTQLSSPPRSNSEQHIIDRLKLGAAIPSFS